MPKDRDPPIEAPGYISGVTVVDIGDIRVARGLTRRPYTSCRHHALLYDDMERRIWCKDCESNVDAFDGFKALVENYDRCLDQLNRREKSVTEAEKFQLRSIAAKKIDEAWRSHNMVPACPHCGHGLFPENFKNGMSMLGKDYAAALANRDKKR